MAALAGLHNIRGAVRSDRDAQALQAAICRFGAVKTHHAGESATLLVARDPLNHRDTRECDLVADDAGLVCAWDGRLDNRDDLALALKHPPFQRNDASFALAAYREWGIDGLGRLVGEWTVAIWNGVSRELILSRDYWGARTLFYHADSVRVIWMSSLGSLVQRLGCYEDLNDDFMVASLMGFRVPCATPYRAIRTVPQGFALCWKSELGPSAHQLWTPSCRELRLRHARDYEDQLRHLFMDAVRRRVNTDGVAWAELSGGHDSTAVVCAADRLIRSGEVRTTSLETISILSHAGGGCNDLPYIQTVERHVHKAGQHLSHEALADVVDDQWDWVSPLQRSGASLALCREVKRLGGTMLLTGQGGDVTMGNYVRTPFEVAACLRNGHVAQAVAGARRRAHVGRLPIYLVLMEALAFLLPVPWTARRLARLRLRGLAAPHGSINQQIRTTWLIPERLCAAWHAYLQNEADLIHRCEDLSKASLELYLKDGSDKLSLPCEMAGFVLSHPMMHRPLVEFALSIPHDIWGPVERPRALMRDAFRGFMPERIVNRVAKGDVGALFMRRAASVAESWIDRLPSLHVVQRGYVDAQLLRSKLETLIRGGCSQLTPIPTLLKLEEWLTRRETQVPAARAAHGEAAALDMTGDGSCNQTESLHHGAA
jgi:asparagine synthase (glutamine-hydrolysing)